MGLHCRGQSAHGATQPRGRHQVSPPPPPPFCVQLCVSESLLLSEQGFGLCVAPGSAQAGPVAACDHALSHCCGVLCCPVRGREPHRRPGDLLAKHVGSLSLSLSRARALSLSRSRSLSLLSLTSLSLSLARARLSGALSVCLSLSISRPMCVSPSLCDFECACARPARVCVQVGLSRWDRRVDVWDSGGRSAISC